MTLENAGNRNLSNNRKAPDDPSIIKTANWSPHVAVHRVAWHNGGGIGRAGMVASGTASGLGRVDIIKGRFVDGKHPGEILDY